MEKKWKNYNKSLLLLFFGILIFFIGLNVLVDPFDIFKIAKIKHFNLIKPDAGRNQRITKIVSLKLEKMPLDSVFLGSSRVNATISEDYYSQITNGLRTKNLGMNALSHDETFKIAKNTVLIHPEIKTLYIGLDFFRFLEKNKDEKRDVILSDNPKLTISEFNPIILSFNTIIATFNTINANLRKQKVVHTNLKEERINYFINKLNQYSNNYKNAVLAEEEITKLKSFKENMEKEGYKVIFYTNQTHAIDLALIDKMGYMDVFDKWKKSLAQNFEYIDFDNVNEITTESVDENTKYFSEMSHGTYNSGNIILDCLLLNKNNFGIKISPNNVNLIIKQNHYLLNKWEESNPFWMNEIKKAILKYEVSDAI